MNQSIYSAARGLIAQQQRVDTVANNIANLNTTGFKGVRMDFKDAVYSSLKDPAGGNGDLQRGSGVMMASTVRSFKQGALQATNEPLDLAAGENQFFVVQNAQGETYYTQDGSFGLSADGSLVNGQGMNVLSSSGSKITIKTSPDNVAVASDGTMYITTTTKGTDGKETTSTTSTKLGVKTFKNPQGLEALPNNVYATTKMSGEPQDPEAISVQQGALESSNVNLATEMTRLIRAQRALQLSSRALTTADGMDGMITQMR